MNRFVFIAIAVILMAAALATVLRQPAAGDGARLNAVLEAILAPIHNHVRAQGRARARS